MTSGEDNDEEATADEVVDPPRWFKDLWAEVEAGIICWCMRNTILLVSVMIL